MFYCELKDEKFPYNSVVGWGVDETEAEMNAWSMRKQIIEKQLSTSQSMVIPVETYDEQRQQLQKLKSKYIKE